MWLESLKFSKLIKSYLWVALMSDNTHWIACARLTDNFNTDPSLSSLLKIRSLAHCLPTKAHVTRWYVAFLFESKKTWKKFERNFKFIKWSIPTASGLWSYWTSWLIDRLRTVGLISRGIFGTKILKFYKWRENWWLVTIKKRNLTNKA